MNKNIPVYYKGQLWTWVDDYNGKCIIQNPYTDEFDSVERNEIEVL